MDESFTRKVRSAAAAGWWTVLVAYCILLIQWLVYVMTMDIQPAGMLFLWGTGVTWVEIRTIWVYALVAFKLVVGTMLFLALWLTFWARQLGKQN